MPVPNNQDHSDEILWVYPPRTESENWWCSQYGNIEIPEGWESLPPGDAFVTRQVKLMGPHWVAKKRAKGYTKTLVLHLVELPQSQFRRPRREYVLLFFRHFRSSLIRRST